jgi:hypothetical protein
VFSAQAQQLANALKSAGIRPDAAQQIAAILGNGVQTLVRTNPETIDTTPPQLKFVDPDTRRYQLQGLDFRQADPDFRPTRLETAENRQEQRPQSNQTSATAPQTTDKPFAVAPGRFMEVKGGADKTQIDLRVTGNGRVALIDSQANSLVGKGMRCESDASGLRFFVEETGTEIVFKLGLGEYLQNFGTQEFTVVTGLALTDQGLLATTALVRVLSALPGDTIKISVTGCA